MHHTETEFAIPYANSSKISVTSGAPLVTRNSLPVTPLPCTYIGNPPNYSTLRLIAAAAHQGLVRESKNRARVSPLSKKGCDSSVRSLSWVSTQNLGMDRLVNTAIAQILIFANRTGISVTIAQAHLSWIRRVTSH